MLVRVRCVSLVVLLVQCAGVEMFSFNVNARVEFKPTSFRLSSYFGYSVLLRKGDPSMVIIGAPKDYNVFTSSVQNPGNIYFCSIPVDNETRVACSPRYIDKSGNARERSYHHRKDNMWLGMTLTGTDYNNGSVVMCAPRWINQYYDDFYLGNGLCYALSEPNAGNVVQQYSSLTPLISRDHQGFQRYAHTQASYLYAYGQAGLSAKISEDGSELLLGAPGIYSWTGSIVRYSIAKQFGSRLFYAVKNTPNPFYTNRLKESSYFGYSVDLGKFDKSRTIYVGGAPRGADYKGQVFLFEFPSRDSGSLDIYEVLEGELFGEYFGSCLLVVDINKDGLDDLIVGAPLYAEKHHYDQGRVHVFINNGDRDIRRQDGFITGDLKLGARFGSAMAKVGDMNDDGYEDVAIGAPYEEDGAGAVYIYLGSAAGLSPSYAQKIQVAGTRGFGISISKGLDIDNNLRNDFAVGAYNSNQVLLFKSHPYIHIQTTVLALPKEISIGATNFTVQICLGFQIGRISGLETSVVVNLKVDEEYSRGQLADPTDSSFTIYGQVGNSYCKDVPVSIDAAILDYSRPINVSLDFGLQKNPLNDSVFCPNCPILHPKTLTKHTLQVPFASGCGDDSVCQPNLKLAVELSVRSPFVIGSASSISVNISVTNDGEPAYLPKVTLTPPAITPILRVPPKCHLINTLLSCDFENPLKEASLGFVSIELDTSNLKSSDQRLTFNVSATSVGDEAHPEDNLQVVDVMLKAEAAINIFGESLKETYYKNLDQDKSNVIFSHLYEKPNFHKSLMVRAAAHMSKLARQEMGNQRVVSRNLPSIPCPIEVSYSKATMLVRVRCVSLVVLLVQCAGVEMFSFNVNARVEFKPTSFRLSSYFGYSVLLRKGDPSMVIIGAPKDFNEYTSTVQNPGNIYFCNIPVDNETRVACKPRTIDTQGNIKEALYHHRKDDMWLGMTLTGTDYNNGSVVMCAPRWIDQQYTYSYHGRGLCYALSDPNAGNVVQQYSSLTPLISREYQNTNNVSLYADGQVGVSAKISEDGSELLLGAPGIYSWTGSIVRYSIAKWFDSRLSYTVRNMPNPSYTNTLQESSYFGYSVDLGKFDKSRTIYVGGAPRGADYKGQVFLFELPSRDSGSLDIYEVLEGELFGEYFGSCLLVVDINKDGLDDLIVGAPLYAEKHHYDQGRVHVFINNGDRDIRRQDGFITGDLKLGARFGSAMAKVGDMNDDGYEDVAIGAPYEEDGAGAVYIYLGSAAGLSQSYAQKIQVAGTRGFGISISKGLDIDDNLRNDFAVGAYNSNQVLLFKSHPYIHIQTTMLALPKEISIGATNFTVQICLGFQIGRISGLETSVVVNLKVDEEYSRGQPADPTDSSFTIYGQVGNSYCKDVPVSIDAAILDFSRPINVSLDFGLQKNPLNDSVFCPNCPILHPKTQTKHTLQVPFACGCGDDSVCQPDLKLAVELSVRSPFVIGSASSISVNIIVTNDGEPAYLPKVTLTPPAITPILRVPPKCHLINTVLSCDFENPLKNSSVGFVSIELDTSNLKISDQRLTFNVSATSVGDEAHQEDNLQVVDVMLKAEAAINIFGENWNETYYQNLDQGKSNMTIINHLYEVYKSGPTALQYFHVLFFVPIQFTDVGTNVTHSLVDVLEQNNEHSPVFCNALNGKFYKASADLSLYSGDETTPEPQSLKQTPLSTKSKLKINDEDGFTAVSIDDFDLPGNNLTSESKALQIQCSDRSRMECLLIHCHITDDLFLSSNESYTKINIRLKPRNIYKLLNDFPEIIFTSNFAAKSANGTVTFGNATWTIVALRSTSVSHSPWIVIISAICGILLLGLLVFGLYKCGFFKRQKREELELLKKGEMGQGGVDDTADK